MDKQQILVAGIAYALMGYMVYQFTKKPEIEKQLFTRPFKYKTTIAGVRG